MKEWFQDQPEGVRIFLQVMIWCVAITFICAMFVIVMGFFIGVSEAMYCWASPGVHEVCGDYARR